MVQLYRQRSRFANLDNLVGGGVIAEPVNNRPALLSVGDIIGPGDPIFRTAARSPQHRTERLAQHRVPRAVQLNVVRRQPRAPNPPRRTGATAPPPLPRPRRTPHALSPVPFSDPARPPHRTRRNT